jgi:hypothetical protein
MAKKLSDDAPHNGYDPDKLALLVKSIEHEKDGLLSEQSQYMIACKPYHERIRQLIKDARIADHIPTKELRAVLDDREYQRKREKLRADLDAEELKNYDQMLALLGDFGTTGLGSAALKKAPGAPNGGEPDVRPRHLQQADRDREASERNAEALKGLKQKKDKGEAAH